VYAHRDWQPPIAFTPDGQALAFGTPDGARLAPVHGGPLQRLAGLGGSWSPDGRRYAYFAGNHLNLPGGTMAVMVGDRLGRHAQVAGRFPFDDHGSWQLGWLPDGRRLSYQDAVDSAGDDLYAVSADGSGIRRLTRDPRNQVDPAWTRDGSELAYVQSDFIGHLCEGCPSTLWRAGPDLQSPEPLTRASTQHTGHFDAHPSWSPAGDAVAFTHAGFDSTSIAVTPVAGGQPTTVLTGSSGPAWSPDGTTLAFCDAHGIEGVAPTGGEVRLLLAAPDHDHPPQDVAWSPNGGMLAFTTDQGLYVAPADGSLPPRKVAALRASHPSFSPDGQWLAFAGGTQTRSVWGAPSQLDIYVVGVDGSDLHAITSTPYDDIDPAWRP
jgi:Tol biopolymer transport system component